MDLTPDQLHLFRASTRWRDFRAAFPDKMAAMSAHALAAQNLCQSRKPTHVLEWRHLYDDRETTFLALLALLSAPLGVHYSRQNEYRFVTTHEFTHQEWKRLMLGRVLGSLCYYACFGLILICGTGFIIGVLHQLLGGRFELGMSAIAILSLLFAIGFFLAANKSRSFGLPDNLKLVAKDIFDLVSVKRINSAKSD